MERLLDLILLKSNYYIAIGIAITVVGTIFFIVNNQVINKKIEERQEIPVTDIQVGGQGNITTHTGVMTVTVIQRIDLTLPSDNVSLTQIAPAWKTRNEPSSGIVAYDENNKQIPSRSFLIEQTLLSALVICDQGSEKIFANTPIMIPFENETMGTVFIKYALPSIMPDNGAWNLKFAFDSSPKIELPKNVMIISNNTRTCSFSNDPLKKITIYDLTLQ